ncbi:reverse transcriptase [Phytophthora megakarya]|uniref:Reverse transcriptase n=1 Tax=Phytophthora megakarya TaxID=4795 RepID=A0A225V2G9_9STRA|nr:reverse transcriptase [Phytophthora megakarya]
MPCRRPPEVLEKLVDLFKGLLSAKMINYSRSPWASPIVVIIKKNGVDIRLCIEYRLVNSLTQLMIYPMPLISDLLEDLESTLWYCSLDMARGFWVVKMTHRAPNDLWLEKCAPIYQRMIDNAQYGFTRFPTSENHGNTLDVFEDGEPVDPGKPSVLGHRSYIYNILIPGLLEACDKWDLSITVVKSFWGMLEVEYLGHKVSSHNGLEANPTGLSALTDLAFPGSLRAMQSFLGSLTYYNRRFYQESQEDQAIGQQKTLDLESQDLTEVDPRWIHTYRSFSVLKSKIVTTPILRHLVYASGWAISGSLMEGYDKIYYPGMFASRTLKSNEVNMVSRRRRYWPYCGS